MIKAPSKHCTANSWEVLILLEVLRVMFGQYSSTTHSTKKTESIPSYPIPATARLGHGLGLSPTCGTRILRMRPHHTGTSAFGDGAALGGDAVGSGGGWPRVAVQKGRNYAGDVVPWVVFHLFPFEMVLNMFWSN